MCTCISGRHHSCLHEWEKEFALSMAEWFGRGGRGRGRGRKKAREELENLELETSSESSNEEMEDESGQVHQTSSK